MNFAEWLATRFDRTAGALPPRKVDVARRLGVRSATVTGWLRGATPDARYLSPLADALGLAPEEREVMLAALAKSAKGAA